VPDDQLVALVTGGLGGIGTAVSRELAGRGYVVVSADIACGDIEKSDGIETIEVDLRSTTSCCDAVEHVVARHSRLDLLVNNAGINARGLPEEMPEEVWAPVVDINLQGTFRMCQAAFAALRDTSNASIVNLSSSAALVAIGGSTMYGVTKAAISHLTKILAVEWARHDIRVNAVAPTIVPSAMTADVLDDQAYMDSKLDSIPLGRFATAEDVAWAVCWLASPQARMTTGLSLPVDGGVSAL
jgi:NAD(P)-dependent dehydrogenase (short-subunit alcohol dehydrogenase family)